MAVHLCKATPVFADIDPETLNLDPQAVRPLITKRTRVILPTDYAGLPSDVPALREAVGNDDILLIRDASHSFGSCLDGNIIGLNHGEDATVFSFDPIKNLTCGEGGALLVDTPDWANTLIAQRQLGFQHSAWAGLYGGVVQEPRVSMTGYRYHMSNLNAAIGLAQFKRLPELLEGKRRVARRYDTQLASASNLTIFRRNYCDIAPFIYPILVDQTQRDDLINYLERQGIHAGARYFPCHRQPLFESLEVVDLPVTERIIREIICLPIYAELQNEEVDEVVQHVRSFLG
jgi:perosamine synthetase